MSHARCRGVPFGTAATRGFLYTEPVSPGCHDALTAFRDTLVADDLFAAIRGLNDTTDYRFTGIYLLDGSWVKSVLLFDRASPNVQIGHDILWDESYCSITAADGTACEITNSLTDPRLAAHAARQAVQCHCGVLLRAPDGHALGTLCHFDVQARETPAGALETLKALRVLVERLLWERVTRTGNAGRRVSKREQLGFSRAT